MPVWRRFVVSRAYASTMTSAILKRGFDHIDTVLGDSCTNWSEAEREFHRGPAMNPGDAAVHNAYGIALMYHSRFAEALEEVHQAMTLG